MLAVVKNAKSENLEYDIYLWISHGYLKTQQLFFYAKYQLTF